MSVDVSPAQDRFVSSANIEAVVVCRQFGRSLMYIRNNKGPRLEPCGAPHCISVRPDAVLLILQICFLYINKIETIAVLFHGLRNDQA